MKRCQCAIRHQKGLRPNAEMPRAGRAVPRSELEWQRQRMALSLAFSRFKESSKPSLLTDSCIRLLFPIGVIVAKASVRECKDGKVVQGHRHHKHAVQLQNVMHCMCMLLSKGVQGFPALYPLCRATAHTPERMVCLNQVFFRRCGRRWCGDDCWDNISLLQRFGRSLNE